MTDPRGAKHVGRALLFERLVADPETTFGEPTRHLPEPRRALDREGLRASVQREVENLLNTRCAWTSVAVGARERTTVDYGLPAVEPSRERGGERYIARVVRQAIEAYEPRLRGVEVDVLGPEAVATRTAKDGGPLPQPGEVLVRISADLVVEDLREPLQFDVAIPAGGGGGG